MTTSKEQQAARCARWRRKNRDKWNAYHTDFVRRQRKAERERLGRKPTALDLTLPPTGH
jgi:hypothetical protein